MRCAVLSLVTAACLVGAGCSSGSSGSSEPATTPRPAPAELADLVETYKVTEADHVDGEIAYPQTPPVGGDHSAAWQNCGVYREPIPEERAVHSMEHGAVWLTYDASVAPGDVEAIEALADGQTHVLVSPFPGQPAPVVATGWGVQMPLDTFDVTLLTTFVTTYQEGPQTPEPGAPCDGALGDPL